MRQVIRCREPIRTSYFYKVGLSRQEDGTVSLSLNGYLTLTPSP